MGNCMLGDYIELKGELFGTIYGLIFLILWR